MSYVRRCLGLVVFVLGGCSGETSGAELIYQLRLQASGVPASAKYIEPQVSVLDSEWRAAAAIVPADLATLTKRDPVTVLLRVSAYDSGQRVAVAARLLDASNQLLAVGGGQLALTRDATLPVSLVETPDARHLALQLARAVPSKLVAGRVTTLYGWGFSPNVQVDIGPQRATQVQWMSSVELVVTVPQGLVAGPVTVGVQNPGGEKDSRADLASVE
ncbi:MAG: IPT/TIG domain-containing protein [Deltaproteobacteria bacterium]|jgi:hypothetical protein|nr:IPT/TIG domain-containing protein [Deltaproteobacteria bacterium]